MPLKSFRCSICGASAPRAYLAHGKFDKRMDWLRHHYVLKHPDKWHWKRDTKTRRNPFWESLLTGAGFGAGIYGIQKGIGWGEKKLKSRKHGR